MPLTHDFKETIRARAQRDPKFRHALLCEAVECVINGDFATGKAVLRDYVNATVGFPDLEKRTRIPAKSLMRMLGPKGSPSAANLSSILTALQNTAEAISGRHLHKQNFRRLVEASAVVEATGQMSHATGGRPAALFRFRREVIQERPSPGLRLGGRG